MVLEAGQELGGYRVIRPLGHGGMGSVYEVEHIKLGVHYALKAFSFQGTSVAELQRRFEAEGRALARLSHRNLVRVIDLSLDEARGIQFFVMDLVLSKDGEARTLADVEPGSVDEDVVLEWFRELMDAVEYIHELGIIHRDIKLNNVLVAEDGHIVLSDLGISRFVDPDFRKKINVSVTRAQTSQESGFALGTSGYMAPELLCGVPASAASDVYALGVLFFKLLTNVWYDPSLAPRKDKDGWTGMTSVKLLEVFDKNWKGVLPRMLDADPERRPRNLRTLHEHVRLADGEDSRRSWLLVVVGVILVLLTAAALAFYWVPRCRAARDFDAVFSADGVLDGEWR